MYLKINQAINNEDTVPEIVNYKNISSNDYTGAYKLKETVNPNSNWSSNLNVVEKNDQLVILFSKTNSELNLLSYNESTFFSDKFYNGIIAFDRLKAGQLYISFDTNQFAIYEKIDSK